MAKKGYGKANRIGRYIREECRKKEITFYWLSRNSGVPLTTLMHIIDGTTKNPGIYTIMRLCRTMKLPVESLVEKLAEQEEQ